MKDIIAVDDRVVDIFAIRESLLESKKLRVRIINQDGGGGLSISYVRSFFSQQARVFDLDGVLISLEPISMQAKKYIDRKNLKVFGPEWLEKQTDYQS